MDEKLQLNHREMMALRQVMNNEAFAPVQRLETVRRARNDVTADWIQNFLSIMYQQQEGNTGTEAHLINESTGQRHDVNSMVESLQQRVGLKSNASLDDFPLTISAADEKKKK